MQVAVGSDHRGYRLKERIVGLLRSQGHHVEDVGPVGDGCVDYPDFASAVAEKVSRREVERGILICGTGIGMAIVANKYRGVRAAPCHDELTAEMSRRHNDVNVLCLSADMLGERLVDRLVVTWIKTEFEGGRHARRVDKIDHIEDSWSGDCGRQHRGDEDARSGPAAEN
jgi:ribose 5-phosphate isomerase B